jgi:DNA-directed RNA polymerase subunit RPC12/RpoP
MQTSRSWRIEADGSERVFGLAEPVYRVARCRCGSDLRFFAATWRMLLEQSDQRSTRAACDSCGHVVVLDRRQLVAIECPAD